MSFQPIITINASTTDANAPLQCSNHPSLSLADVAAILTNMANQAHRANSANVEQGNFASIVSKFVLPVVEAAVEEKRKK